MAAVTKTFPAHTSQDVCVCSWSLTTADPTGDPVQLGNYSDRSVQVEGSFGGGTVVWEGSLDGQNYHTLTNLLGQGLSSVAPSLEPVAEMTVYIRPRLVGGTAAAVSAVLASRLSVR